MNKTEAIDLLRQYLPPDRLREFLKAWWQWSLEDEVLANHLQPAQDALANGPQVDDTAREEIETWREVIHEERPHVEDSGEPFLEDCPHCGGAHLAGTIALCPLNKAPIGDVVAAYRAMEAALQLLTANILNLRTELLAIKAEVMKGDEL